MLQQAMDILSQLGLMQVIQIIGVSVGAIFIYRYFTSHV